MISPTATSAQLSKERKKFIKSQSIGSSLVSSHIPTKSSSISTTISFVQSSNKSLKQHPQMEVRKYSSPKHNSFNAQIFNSMAASVQTSPKQQQFEQSSPPNNHQQSTKQSNKQQQIEITTFDHQVLAPQTSKISKESQRQIHQQWSNQTTSSTFEENLQQQLSMQKANNPSFMKFKDLFISKRLSDENGNIYPQTNMPFDAQAHFNNSGRGLKQNLFHQKKSSLLKPSIDFFSPKNQIEQPKNLSNSNIVSNNSKGNKKKNPSIMKSDLSNDYLLKNVASTPLNLNISQNGQQQVNNSGNSAETIDYTLLITQKRQLELQLDQVNQQITLYKQNGNNKQSNSFSTTSKYENEQTFQLKTQNLISTNFQRSNDLLDSSLFFTGPQSVRNTKDSHGINAIKQLGSNFSGIRAQSANNSVNNPNLNDNKSSQSQEKDVALYSPQLTSHRQMNKGDETIDRGNVSQQLNKIKQRVINLLSTQKSEKNAIAQINQILLKKLNQQNISSEKLNTIIQPSLITTSSQPQKQKVTNQQSLVQSRKIEMTNQNNSNVIPRILSDTLPSAREIVSEKQSKQKSDQMMKKPINAPLLSEGMFHSIRPRNQHPQSAKNASTSAKQLSYFPSTQMQQNLHP